MDSCIKSFDTGVFAPSYCCNAIGLLQNLLYLLPIYKDSAIIKRSEWKQVKILYGHAAVRCKMLFFYPKPQIGDKPLGDREGEEKCTESKYFPIIK